MRRGMNHSSKSSGQTGVQEFRSSGVQEFRSSGVFRGEKNSAGSQSSSSDFLEAKTGMSLFCNS
jgi:hypothetical protein